MVMQRHPDGHRMSVPSRRRSTWKLEANITALTLNPLSLDPDTLFDLPVIEHATLYCCASYYFIQRMRAQLYHTSHQAQLKLSAMT